MPENGLVWNADKRRWKFVLDGSGSHSGIGSGSYSATATGRVYYTPDALTESSLFVVAMSIDIDAGTSSVTYTGPGAPLGATYSSTVPLVVEVVLEGDAVYNIGGNWQQKGGTLKVYVGGVLKLSTSVDGTTSGGLGPHYLMYGGEEVWASLSSSAGTTGLPGTLPDTYAYSSSVDATLTLWCEWQEPGSGVWTGSPVSFHSSTAPSVPGTCTDPGLGTATGTTTSGFAVGCHAEQSVTRTEYDSGTLTRVCTHAYCDGVEMPGSPYCIDQPGDGIDWTRWKTVTESKTTSVSVGLVADREKSVGRIDTGTKFLMYRTEMPETKWAGAASCDDDGSVTSTTTGGTVHPHQDVILEVVTDTAAAMEDTFGYHSYSEKSVSGGWAKTVAYDDDLAGVLYPSVPPCDDPDAVQTLVDVYTGYTADPPDESYSSSRSYSFPSYVGPSSDMAGYLGHTADRPRYINSWCNPHWSFFLWFESWDVDSAPETPADYWFPMRQQWLDDALLASPPQSRNHIVSDGLGNDTGMRSFFDTFTAGLPWVGVSRFQTKAVTPLTDYTYDHDSESLWSVDDGTLSSDATGVKSTPTGSFAGNPTFKMLLHSFTVEPYLWPALADAGVFDWDTGNISAVAVKLEGRNGEQVSWPVSRGVQSAWPKGSPAKYCGSWAQDYAADGVTDQGADFDASGDSAAVYADPAISTAAMGLADRTAKYLVFTVTPVDATLPVTVKWPRLKYTKSASRLLVAESAQDQAVVHPDGPGVRVGDLQWYDSVLGWSNPPLVGPGVYKQTAVDGLEIERVLLRGVAYDGGSPDLTTELTQRWTSYEVNNVAGVARDSVSFFFPVAVTADWDLALVNVMAEVPPTGIIPVRGRDDRWQPTGDFVQETWVWAQDKCRHVSSLTPGDVFTGGDVQWTSNGTAVASWCVTEHAHALDNTESGFKLFQGTTQRGKDWRPWRGFFAVWPPVTDAVGVDACRAPDGRMFRVWAMADGTVRTESCDTGRAWNGVDQSFTADAVSVNAAMTGRGNKVFLLYADGGTVYERESGDGVTWSVATSVGTGTQAKGWAGADGRRFRYYLDSGVIYADCLDAAGNTIESAHDTGVSGVDDASFGAMDYYYGQNRRGCLLECVVSGTVTEYSSQNGLDFS